MRKLLAKGTHLMEKYYKKNITEIEILQERIDLLEELCLDMFRDAYGWTVRDGQTTWIEYRDRMQELGLVD